MKVKRSGGRSASRCKKGIGVDDRQPVIILQEDLCILLTEVIWVGDEKRNHPREAWVRMGRVKILHEI